MFRNVFAAVGLGWMVVAVSATVQGATPKQKAFTPDQGWKELIPSTEVKSTKGSIPYIYLLRAGKTNAISVEPADMDGGKVVDVVFVETKKPEPNAEVAVEAFAANGDLIYLGPPGEYKSGDRVFNLKWGTEKLGLPTVAKVRAVWRSRNAQLKEVNAGREAARQAGFPLLPRFEVGETFAGVSFKDAKGREVNADTFKEGITVVVLWEAGHEHTVAWLKAVTTLSQVYPKLKVIAVCRNEAGTSADVQQPVIPDKWFQIKVGYTDPVGRHWTMGHCGFWNWGLNKIPIARNGKIEKVLHFPNVDELMADLREMLSK